MADQETLTRTVSELEADQSVVICLVDGKRVDGIIEKKRNPNGWVLSVNFRRGNIYFDRVAREWKYYEGNCLAVSISSISAPFQPRLTIKKP